MIWVGDCGNTEQKESQSLDVKNWGTQLDSSSFRQMWCSKTNKLTGSLDFVIVPTRLYIPKVMSIQRRGGSSGLTRSSRWHGENLRPTQHKGTRKWIGAHEMWYENSTQNKPKT